MYQVLEEKNGEQETVPSPKLSRGDRYWSHNFKNEGQFQSKVKGQRKKSMVCLRGTRGPGLSAVRCHSLLRGVHLEASTLKAGQVRRWSWAAPSPHLHLHGPFQPAP